jgi:hypothetical protein
MTTSERLDYGQKLYRDLAQRRHVRDNPGGLSFQRLDTIELRERRWSVKYCRTTVR